jgi:threonine/homoserine/homoserine lactone efflux protein
VGVELAAFLAVATIVIVTPGQDTVLTIRNTLSGGRRDGALTAVGVSAGQGVWTLAASAGVAAVIAASEPAFLALRLAGAAYLVYLGLQSLRNALRGLTHEVRAHHGRAAPFRQGLLSNLGNPKMAVFFTSLLPQFGASSFWSLLLLGATFCLMTLTWLSAYAAAVAKAGDVLRRPRVRRAIDAIAGTFLVLFGVRLATDRS